MYRSKLRFLSFCLVLATALVVQPLRFMPFVPSTVSAMNLVRVESRIDDAVSTYGVTGNGVLIAVLDRGIDWQNNDFRNPDGTTRIEYIFDLTDDTGAFDPGNIYGQGTIYTKQQINQALQGGPALATRDAVGHGSTTTGIIAGNGRNVSQYRGVAPNAAIISVKIVAGASNSVPPEPVFANTLGVLPTAIDFVRDKAQQLNKPCVMLANIGSQQGPTDGTSDLCQKIDQTVGPGHPGLVFVTGPGDDGGMPNRCGGTVTQGNTASIQIQKGNPGNLRLDLWYPGADRFDVSLQTPLGSFGPYASPATNNNTFSVTAGGVTLNHQGSNVDFFSSTNGKRELLIDITGATGTYTINLIGATVSNGRFDGIINPSMKFNTSANLNRFLTFVAPGSVWDGASALNNISPGDYVVRTAWTDIDGIPRTLTTQGSIGEIWQGSSIGPTFDGRLGVDVCAPGDSLFAPLAPNSSNANFRFNMIQDGLGFYTRQNAVSAAAPIVTGIIALMLERNRNLDAVTVRNLLRSTARADSFTGAVPNTTWGYGKVDALAAVGAVTPTAVKFEGFTATAHDSNVLLKWQTGVEVDNLGFNVYRDVDGARTRITPQLVAGSALSDGPGTSLLSGRSYYWADTPPPGKAVRYWLEDIDLNGKSTFNGPYAMTNSPPGRAADAQKQSDLISQIGARQGLLANGLGSTPLARAATLATPGAATSQLQSDLTSKPAVKIAVKQEGLYRVTQPELVRSGLDPRVDPRLLQLFADGIEQAIKITGEQDGHLDAGDSVEFYGVGLEAASTDTRVYWLVAGTKPGKRIAITQGKGEKLASGGFLFTVERKERTIYFSALRNGDTENFFGAVVASQPVDQSLWIRHLNRTPGDPATIEVSLQGVTSISHDVRVELNGTAITRLNFAGQSSGKKLASISPSLLREGENTVRLIAEGGQGDVSLVDSIRITYSHSYVADSDVLRLTVQSGERVSISGFASRNVRLLDVTDAAAAQEIATTVTASKDGYTVRGAVGGSGNRRLLAVADSQVSRPWTIAENQPSSLRQAGNGADLLIITQRDYISAVSTLKALRESQGLSVAVVDVEDIYDEFSFGNNTPQAVKDFAAYAATNWKKRPRYVLLAGDASYDPKNYLGLGGFDLVPTKLLDTAYMETASDDWFADFNSDGVPELAVGRLPFRNAAEASTMIAKIVGYDRSSPSEEALLVADANDGFDFEAASAQLGGSIPASLRLNQINRGTDTATAKARLMDAIARGQKLVNYAGHGSVNQWRGNLLVNEDAALMKNADRLSVFVMMTCLNGYFDDPALDSLAESLLKADRGGAVAVWSSSGMTLPGEQAAMNQELYRLMFGEGGLSLGEAIVGAKASVSDIDLRRTWILLGDPTMKLR